MSPAQQRSPGVPHWVHVPFPLQTRSAPLHVSFPQQGWPAPPHWAQTSLLQPSPELQEPFEQHTCPAPPHGPHTLFAHPRLGPHAWLLQQA
jgi:hypothetical protein